MRNCKKFLLSTKSRWRWGGPRPTAHVEQKWTRMRANRPSGSSRDPRQLPPTPRPKCQRKEETTNEAIDYQTQVVLDTKGPEAPEGHTHRLAELRLGRLARRAKR